MYLSTTNLLPNLNYTFLDKELLAIPCIHSSASSRWVYDVYCTVIAVLSVFQILLATLSRLDAIIESIMLQLDYPLLK